MFISRDKIGERSHQKRVHSVCVCVCVCVSIHMDKKIDLKGALGHAL